MPPSLLSARFANDSLCTEWPAFHTRPLTLALSPGRGNRFVDADSMLQLYDALNPLRGASSITTSHIFKPRDSPNPKP